VRVPRDAAPGRYRIEVRYDAGPLGGPILATQELTVE